jgi:Helix-turn-helix domain
VDGPDDRLARIEERLAALEDAARQPGQEAQDRPRERFWALEALAEDAAALPGGAVLYAGRVTLPTGEEYAWQRTHSAAEARGGTDDDAAAAVLSALGHPVRLRLLREVLTGTRTTAQLADLPGLGTTGQLHHHLRALVAAGWLASTGRGRWSIPGPRVIPLLVVIVAATTR